MAFPFNLPPPNSICTERFPWPLSKTGGYTQRSHAGHSLKETHNQRFSTRKVVYQIECLPQMLRFRHLCLTALKSRGLRRPVFILVSPKLLASVTDSFNSRVKWMQLPRTMSFLWNLRPVVSATVHYNHLKSLLKHKRAQGSPMMPATCCLTK